MNAFCRKWLEFGLRRAIAYPVFLAKRSNRSHQANREAGKNVCVYKKSSDVGGCLKREVPTRAISVNSTVRAQVRHSGEGDVSFAILKRDIELGYFSILDQGMLQDTVSSGIHYPTGMKRRKIPRSSKNDFNALDCV